MSDKKSKTIVTVAMSPEAADKLTQLVIDGKLEKDEHGRIIWDEEKFAAIARERQTSKQVQEIPEQEGEDAESN